MDIQTLIVALIVAPSVVYATWSMMPNSWREAVAKGLLKGRWPASISLWLVKTAAGASGCGCSGCDSNPAKPKGAGKAGRSPSTGSSGQPVQVIRIHPRVRR